MAYIYSITSKQSGRIYIGQTTNPSNRWYNHRYTLERNKSHMPLLQIEYNEFGLDNFEFAIIEDTLTPNEREIYHINQVESGKSLNIVERKGQASASWKRLREIRRRNNQ